VREHFDATTGGDRNRITGQRALAGEFVFAAKDRVPFSAIDRAFGQQIQRRSLTEVTGNTEEVHRSSSVSPVRAISVQATDECAIGKKATAVQSGD
jgi:hypothetical protein